MQWLYIQIVLPIWFIVVHLRELSMYSFVLLKEVKPEFPLHWSVFLVRSSSTSHLCTYLRKAPYRCTQRSVGIYTLFTWVISSWDDFHLGVWSFTCKCLHDFELQCVCPGMISSQCWRPGWNDPGAEDRDEITLGQTHFSSKSCWHIQVNDQTPRGKSFQDEMKLILGWNHSCKSSFSEDLVLNRVLISSIFVLNRVPLHNLLDSLIYRNPTTSRNFTSLPMDNILKYEIGSD